MGPEGDAPEQHRSGAKEVSRAAVWSVVLWARVITGLGLSVAGGVAFGHAWTREYAPLWWVGGISLLTGILVLLSVFYARSRPPAISLETAVREVSTQTQEPLVPLLGALLVYKYQAISHKHLTQALTRQKTEKRLLGEILVDMKLITRAQLRQALDYQELQMERRREAAESRSESADKTGVETPS